MDAVETGLVVRATRGDREAFDQVAERCRPWLLGLSIHLLRDYSAAQDAVQEALLLAWRDLPQLREPGRFRAWLSRIAVNACRMKLRGEVAHAWELRAALEGTPVAAVEGPDTEGEVLGRLGHDARRLVMLFYGQGLSHQEIAEALSLSTSAVKSRLHRARERLRREMLAMMSEEQRARLGVAGGDKWELRTVLLVEPEEPIRASLLQALRAAGYHVEMLPTGEAALEAIREHRGQMLILDKHCGEPHWTEVLLLLAVDSWARENVPVGVLVDRESHDRDLLLAWQGGAQFCLTRPPAAEEVTHYAKQVADLWGGRSCTASAME